MKDRSEYETYRSMYYRILQMVWLFSSYKLSVYVNNLEM